METILIRRQVQILILLALILGAAARPSAAQDTVQSCGGNGQVPCYSWDWCAHEVAGLCLGGLIANGYGGCNSDRQNNYFGVACGPCGSAGAPLCLFGQQCDAWHNNVGLCIPCGGQGQPVCFGEPQCKPGHTDVLGFCSYRGHSDEPSTGVDSLPDQRQPAPAPVRGIADLHTHQFSNLGFGGALFWGKPYHQHGIDKALAWCDYTHDFNTVTSISGLSAPTVPYLGHEVHGPRGVQGLTAPLSLFTEEGEHSVGGTGDFGGWPQWSTVTHQQMYYKWLERAVQGGLRLMVNLAVSNEVLCGATKHVDGYTCNDMENVDRQLAAAREMETAIDNMSGGPGRGWYRIATSPQQARAIIRDGKLAVVLGIEVDSLFGCKPGTTCDAAYIDEQVKKYKDTGVRHIFPVHVFDNAFGGAAIFNEMFNAGQVFATGSPYGVRDCSAPANGGYAFNLSSLLPGFLDPLFRFFGAGIPDYGATAADCNSRGLTAAGQNLLNSLMNHRLIIDVDHTSQLMREAVLDIAEARQYPLVAGHATYFDKSDEPSEYNLKADEMTRLRDLGGIVTIPVPRGPEGTTADYQDIYDYAVEKMKDGPYGAAHPGIAFSTDFNGIIHQTAPRFGVGNAADKGARVNYPFSGLLGGQFWKQHTGVRDFDFNNDGLAHYGMLPDFFQDLKNVGMTNADLDPMLNSAETYIRMWERIVNGAPVEITPHVEGVLGSNGWYRSDVTVTWTVEATDPRSGPATDITGCDPAEVTTDTWAEGVVLTCSASNGAGDTSVSVTIKRDTVPPSVRSFGRMPLEPASGWNNGDVMVLFLAADVLSGVPQAAELVTVSTGGANQTASYVFRDEAGNETQARLGGINIDKIGPTIGVRLLGDGPNQSGWYNTDVLYEVVAFDPLSGVDGDRFPENPFAVSGEGFAVTGEIRVYDRAGNLSTLSPPPVKIDRTGPAITGSWLVPSQPPPGTWVSMPITLQWRCTDALSSVPGSGFLGSGPYIFNTVFGSEGENLTATAPCQDLAGNVSIGEVHGINIDRFPPLVTDVWRSPMAPPGAWVNTEVTVHWRCLDSGSGPVDSIGTKVVTAEGANQTVTMECRDRSGKTTTQVMGGINIDRTPPLASLQTLTPPDGQNFWNLGNVTARWTCSDSASGPIAPEVVATLSGEGVEQSITGTCRDRAGNTANHTVQHVRIDKTPPVATLVSRIPAAGPGGWATTDVIVTWECRDQISGPVAPSVAATVTGEGANLTAAASCTDRAGRTVTATLGGISIDRTPPTITAPAAITLEALVATGVTLSDAALGVPAAFDALGPVAIARSPMVNVFPVGVTLVIWTATDAAGLVASATQTIAVLPPPTVEQLVARLEELITIKKLDAALNRIVRAFNQDRDGAACRRIDGLVETVEQMDEALLNAADQAAVIGLARQLQSTAGCFTSTLEVDALIAELEQMMTLKKLDNALNRILRSLNRYEAGHACRQIDQVIQSIQKTNPKKLSDEDKTELTGKIRQLGALLGCTTV